MASDSKGQVMSEAAQQDFRCPFLVEHCSSHKYGKSTCSACITACETAPCSVSRDLLHFVTHPMCKPHMCTRANASQLDCTDTQVTHLLPDQVLQRL